MKKKARSPPLCSFEELRDIDLDDDVREMLDVAEGCFQNTECWIIRVPARLCLAADHTDYWDDAFDAELITFASDSCTMKAIVSPRNDSRVGMFNMNENYKECTYLVKRGEPDYDWESWLDSGTISSNAKGHWSDYIEGVVKHAERARHLKQGFDILIGSNIPPASGASSSSALTICAAIATRLTNELNMHPSRVAADTAKAEWFVGTRGGEMDHVTMVHSEKNRFLKFNLSVEGGWVAIQAGEDARKQLEEMYLEDRFSFETELIKVPEVLENYCFMTIFSHAADKGRGGVKAQFNARAKVARKLPQRLWDEAWRDAGDLGDVAELREIQKKLTNELVEGFVDLFNAHEYMSHLVNVNAVQNWFGFAVNEFERSRRVQKLLEESMDVNELGEIMDEAWQEAGDLYGIRTEKMDAIAEVCRSCDGVLGLKVMGAGFGGNLLALVRKDSIDDLRAICDENSELFERSIEDSLFVHKPGPGVSICTGPADDFGWRLLWPSVEE